jgi:PhnB protein
MAVRPIPEGYHTLTPSLTCKNAASAIDFYSRAFGAKELSRMAGPGGSVAHAELQIGDSRFFISDEFPGMSAAPVSSALPSTYMFLYVENVDKSFEQAVSAGAKAEMPVTDMFWGDRYGKVTDPFGHHWGIATHKEDVSPEEMERRGAEWMANMAKMSKAAGQD